MLAVILSGGSGTRLWPLSREAYPKQFLPVVSEDSLLAETIDRGLGLGDDAQVMAITNEEHRFVVAAHLHAQAGGRTAGIVLEPVGRNTAPAIALAALAAAEKNPAELMLVMPSDHVLKNAEAFGKAVAHGARAAEAGKLVTFGIVPTTAHTGYGYIKAGQSQGDYSDVAAFVEKPDAATAQGYLDEGDYFWNSGIFLFRADRYLQELEKHQPEMMKACRAAWDKRAEDMDFTRVDKAAFEACPDDSIDYAVMEKTSDAVVVPLDAGWSDVGSWSALWEIQPQDEQGNVCRGDVIVEDVTGVAPVAPKDKDVGKPLDIQFTATDGTKVDLAKMKGKVVQIDFWATCCGPCVAELSQCKESLCQAASQGI